MDRGAPFHTHYAPREHIHPVVARRPIVARALRADLITPAPGPVLVWGEPYIGKSTLVRQVLWSLEPDTFIAARLPVGALAETLSPSSRGVGMLCDQVRVQLETYDVDVEPLESADSLATVVKAARSAASDTGRVLILAIEGVDRYAGGVWPRGVRENLDALLSNASDTGILMTSRSPLARLGELAIPEHVRVHFVPRLDYEEARQLLTEAVEWLRFEPESLEWLLAAAGGRPFLLQIIGRNASRMSRQSDAATIDARRAQEILTSCWLAGENLYRALLGNLAPTAQQVLAATATATTPQQPTARFEAIYQQFRRANSEVELAAFGNELSLLRLARLVESDEQDEFWIGCGWLADYLRAGAAG